MTADSPHTMTAEEVAANLRVSLSQVYKLAKLGTLPAYKVGKLWRFHRIEVVQFIKDQRPKTCQ